MRSIISSCLKSSLIAVFLAGGFAPASAQDDAEATTRTLTIATLDLEGKPVPGIEFTIEEKPTGSKSELATNQLGQIRIPVEPGEAFDDLKITMTETRYQILSRANMDQGGRRLMLHELYPADYTKLNALQKRRLALVFGDVLSAQRQKADEIPGLPSEPHRLRTSAFLAQWRPNVPRTLRLKEEIEENSALISVQVIDDRGQPVNNRLVDLLTFDEEKKEVVLYNRERTDREGYVFFTAVMPDRLYRVISKEEDGLKANGPFVAVGPKEERILKPMVILAPGQSLSGLVYDGELPFRNAKVRVRGKGQPPLSTTTNEYGFFRLGPLQQGEATLDIIARRGGEVQKATVTISTDREEILLPLELLTGSEE